MKKKLSLISTIIFFVALIPVMAFSQEKELIGAYELNIVDFFESMGIDVEEMGDYEFSICIYLYDNNTFEYYSYMEGYGEEKNIGEVKWLDDKTISMTATHYEYYDVNEDEWYGDSYDSDEEVIGYFENGNLILQDSEYSMVFLPINW